MRYLIQIMFNLILPTVPAFLYTGKDGVVFEYNIDFKQKCQAQDHRFAFLYGLSVSECVKECALRKHCAALNFWRRLGGCELFLLAVQGTVENGNCFYVFADDIDVKEEPCSDCIMGEVCDTENRACTFKECSQVTVAQNGKVLGNANKIGSWIHYECNAGYLTQNGNQRARALCGADGLWNVTNCVQVEVTTALTFPSSSSTSTSTSSTCVTMDDYTGSLSVTKTGKTCQRWDNQWPHSHLFDTPDDFPDTSVQGAANYCRASGYQHLWCYTMDPDTRWEKCDNPAEVCQES